MIAARNDYRLIGLCGRAEAGKDTCADVLQAAYDFQRIAFADALREEISHSFGVDLRELLRRDTKEIRNPALAIGRSDDGRFIAIMASTGVCISSPRSPREITRWWGTEYRRKLDGEHYWVQRARDRLDSAFRRGARRVVFTDVRFPNEAEFIRSYGGQVWRLRRALADSRPADHVSESELAAIMPDVTLHNDSTLETFATDVRNAYSIAGHVYG